MPRMVVTGTSTGLGLAVCEHARRNGWDVLGTVRRDQDRSAMDDIGAASALLDITDADSVAACAEEVRSWSMGHLDCLVNNAGTAYAGSIEEIELDDLRAQFEVNVIGHVAVTQELLPALRSARGTIVVISSVGAGATLPMVGGYAASKRAIEAIAEALDLELADQGVRTIVIRPGAFRTSIWTTSLTRAQKYEGPASRYVDLAAKMREMALDDAQMSDPELLARHALDVVERRRAPFRSNFPRSAETLLAPRMPWRIYKRAVRRRLGA